MLGDEEVLAALAAANPVATVREADGIEARALLARIVEVDPHPAGVPLHKRRRLLAGVAAILAAAVGLTAALLPRPELGVPAAQAAVLERIAARAAQQPLATSGPYLYVKTKQLNAVINADSPAWTALYTSEVETWIARNGFGRIREVRGTPYFPSQRDRNRWLASGSPTILGGGRVVVMPNTRLGSTLAYRPSGCAADSCAIFLPVAELPTDPSALEQLLRDYANAKDPPATAAILTEIFDLLSAPEATPALRAALYQVMARLPEVRLYGTVRDPVGRNGIAIGSDTSYGGRWRRLLIVDADSGGVLAKEELLTKTSDETGATPPAMLGYTAYLQTGNVDSTSDRP
jgi:hypothetical protein